MDGIKDDWREIMILQYIVPALAVVTMVVFAVVVWKIVDHT
jgi:hypothetical protein